MEQWRVFGRRGWQHGYQLLYFRSTVHSTATTEAGTPLGLVRFRSMWLLPLLQPLIPTDIVGQKLNQQ